MKNYITEARRAGISLYSLSSDKYIENYKINRGNNYVSIKYMNGPTETKSLSDISEEELEITQQKQLYELNKKISSKVDENVNWKKPLVMMWGCVAVLNLSVSNILASICNLLCGGIYLSQVYRPMKIKKDIQLATWIYENKEAVDNLIKQETESLIQKQNIDYESLPYPKEIISDGVNLNNIELLETKQLKKIKRKITRM